MINNYDTGVLVNNTCIDEEVAVESLFQTEGREEAEVKKEQEEMYLDALIEEGRTEFKTHKTTKINPFNIWEHLPIQ
jgi:hypothetical protein